VRDTQPTRSARSGTPGRVNLLGLELDNVTSAEAIDRVMAALAEGRGGWVLTPNLHILRKFVIDPSYSSVAGGSTLRVADGMPLIWASRLRRTPLVERVAGSELIWDLSARAAKEGRSVFFLGGNPGTAERAAAKLREQSPSLKVAGCDCPPMGYEKDPETLARIERLVTEARPDICYIGITPDKGDYLISRLRTLLPGTWFMGVGISFSYVCGDVRHAPVWMRRVGLEWFYRLVQEPRRLGRRYLVEGVPFALRLFLVSFREGLRAAPPPASPGSP
jgi:N-acetylglucosaminyldiphosphoundecaprenol N-acetyl-beta-D-mannosaminyltransferase